MGTQPANPPYVCNPNWAIPHGFFGILASTDRDHGATLNGGHVNNTPEHAYKNRILALQAIGLDSVGWMPNQKHTDRVLELPKDLSHIHAPADALVGRDPHGALGVLTADCAPVLFYDARAGVIGAAHAGWRGAISGVLENTVQAMYKLGGHSSTLQATIGPMIAWKSYQVSENFLQTIQNATSWDIGAAVHWVEGQWFFDLPLYVCMRLGSLVSHIYDVKIDTFGGKFFSHRYGLLQDRMDCAPNLSSNQIAAGSSAHHGRNISWISHPSR